MAVRCAQCGEDLLGAVNRCWRCGANVLSRAGDACLPPVRRPPLPMPLESTAIAEEPEFVTAAFADQGSPGEAQGTSQPAEGIAPVRSGTRSTNRESQAARRVGSPFAEGTHGGRRGLHVAASLRDATPGLGETSRRGIGTTNQSRAKAGVIAGFVLGLFGIVASFFTVWAVIAAILGLGLGLWGLHSAHRGTAVVTIVLCCLTLLIGSFFGLADWYETHYGYKPWDAPEGMTR